MCMSLEECMGDIGYITGYVRGRIEHLGPGLIDIPIDERRRMMKDMIENIAESRDLDMATVYDLIDSMWDRYYGAWYECDASKIMLYMRLMGVEHGIPDSVRLELERDVRQQAAAGYSMPEIAERVQPNLQCWRNGRRTNDFTTGNIFRQRGEHNLHFGIDMLVRSFYYVEQSEEDFSGQNIIFLDVEGVLNCQSTTDIIDGEVGIDDEKVALLKEMVDIMDARIVLVSLWKQLWYAYSKDLQDDLASTLDERLEQHGLVINDLTEDVSDYWDRGQGILNWIDRQKSAVGRILILDDEAYDYVECGLDRYQIRTSYYGEHGGLQPEHVERLRQMLPDLQYIPKDQERLDRAEDHGMEKERSRIVHALAETGRTPQEIAEWICLDLQLVQNLLNKNEL